MKRSKRILALLTALILCAALSPAAFAEGESYSVQVECSYDQTGARSMLEMVNALRTGEDAWQWDEDGNKQVLEGLEALQYSYDLEEIAMQRAVEVALSFSHTRPDGTACFTCLASSGNRSWGENIAAGYPTPAAAFEGWCEADEPYAGQGHRRNMLEGGFFCIGIAHVIYNGTHYWVQEFSWYDIPGTECSPCDGAQTRRVEVAASSVTGYGTARIETESMTLNAGDSAPAPRASSVLTIQNAWGGKAPTAWVTPDWQSGDENVATVSDGVVTAVGPGKTSLQAEVFGGQTLTAELTVKAVLNPDRTAEVRGASISLNGDIGLNFYVFLPEKLLEDEGACVTLNERTFPVSGADTLDVDGRTAHRFSWAAAAKEMGCRVTLRVYDGEGKQLSLVFQGEDISETGFTYSVRDYLDYVINNVDSLTLVDLAYAMRDYGSCAQLFFQFETDDRAELTDRPGAVQAEELPEPQTNLTEAEASPLLYKGSSLLLRSNTVVHHYFRLKEGAIDDYVFRLNGVEVSPVRYGDFWCVERSDIAAKDLGEQGKLTVFRDGEILFSMDYSPMDYVYKVLRENRGGEELQLLCRALYLYYTAARAYF